MPDKKESENRKDYKRDKKKGGYYKPRDVEKKPTKMFGDNDISWWAFSEQLLKDVGRLPFGRPLGNDQRQGLTVPTYSSGANYSLAFNNVNVPIPGIAVINYSNICGISKDAASPINVAARAIYSFVRHANSGHANYESPDLMCYLLAVGDVYTAIAYLTKVYGVCQFWSQRNRYFGDRLIRALGFDEDDVRAHLSDLRAGINMISVKANTLVAPKNFPIFERRYFLPTHIYKDEDNEKAQLYTFKPVTILEFSGTAASTGSCLLPIATPWASGSSCTVSAALDFISDLIDKMLAEEDLGIMGGDILKAYKDSGVHQLLSIPDTYAAIPIYNEEMLRQIHNLNIVFCNYGISQATADSESITVSTADDILRWRNSGGMIGQINGYLISGANLTVRKLEATNVYVNKAVSPATGSVSTKSVPSPFVPECVIDLHHDDPSPEDVMIATRLSCTVSDTTFTASSTSYYELRSCGTEIIRYIDVWDNHSRLMLSSKAFIKPFAGVVTAASGGNTSFAIADTQSNMEHEAAVRLTKFKRSPVLLAYQSRITFSASNTLSGQTFDVEFLSDVDVTYCSTLDSTVLDNLHESALLSVFKVPQLGIYNS